jgi:hypothetical protein
MRRIHHNAVKAYFQAHPDGILWACPSKLFPFEPWRPSCPITKTEVLGDNWESWKNCFRIYNCNWETGYGIAYYEE